MTKFRVSMLIDADSVDKAAQLLADLLTASPGSENYVSEVVTHGPSPVLRFAEKEPT